MIPTLVNPIQGQVGGFFNPLSINSQSTGVSTDPSMISGDLMNHEDVNSHPILQTRNFNSVSADSVIVSDTPSFPNPELVNVACSPVDALPSLVLGHTNAANPTFQVKAPRPNPHVKGKGLACASGVKTPCF
uniref:Uncharacterized protein n=1 Tax=Cannabis sativa TaxID=3483 RepID=A0A803P3V5_CANSA